jgi:uncharacterized membrane protein YccC
MWADPDTDAAAAAMRWAFENPELAAEIGRRGGREIRRGHAPEVAGEAIERALLPAWNEVAEHRTAPAGRDPSGWDEIAEGRSEIADRARGLLSLESVPGRSGTRGLRRSARSLLSRALRPHTSYQREVDSALLGSIDELLRRVADLEAELSETRAGPAAERAALFAELRRIADRVEDESGTLRRALDDLAAERRE